jgi:tetratricopeptide (TPR) repeat protein
LEFYKNLGLEIKSIEQYKKAFEFKNSLAASNLAYQLIHLGFSKEAEEYLNKAEEFENPHENVFKAISAIKSKITEEKELEEKILKKQIENIGFLIILEMQFLLQKLLKFKIRINGI